MAPTAVQERKAKELEELNRTLAELGIQQPAPADVDAEAEEKKKRKKKDKCEPQLFGCSCIRREAAAEVLLSAETAFVVLTLHDGCRHVHYE